MLSEIVSRPWMKRFYRNADTSFTHMEGFRQVNIIIIFDISSVYGLFSALYITYLLLINVLVIYFE